jgi:putative transposase
MPRQARISIPDIPYHITQRGNFKENIFDEDADREVYLDLFFAYSLEYGLKVYAWCLMDNHIHFVVEPKSKNSMWKVFKSLNTRYSHYLNKKRAKRGQLWQGRFYSCPLDEFHFYETVRYVELNPIRANMVTLIKDYKWSSSYKRLGQASNYVICSVETYFSVSSWIDYLNEGVNRDMQLRIKQNTMSGKPLGSQRFSEKHSF